MNKELKPEDIKISIELTPNGFGSPKRIIKVEHIPTGTVARYGEHRSDHANRAEAIKVLTKKVKSYKPPEKKFPYAVAHYWEDKQSIGTYCYGNEVHNGTMEEANFFLTYVKKQSPDKDWKIFMLVELPT